MRLRKLTLILVATLTTAVACTRKAPNDAKVSLSFAGKTSQRNSVQSTSTLPTTIIVNISGSGISPTILYQWDSHCGNPTCLTPPSSVELAVPSGSSRLIQVLLVYEDGSSFSYGDVVTDLQAGANAVDITVTSAGGSKRQAHVAGRWMDGSAAGGPNGFLDARFQPPGGHPAMTVMRQYVFAGWMNLMLLDTANFTYVLNGQPLFNEVNLTSAPFASSPNVLRVSVPESNRNGGLDHDDAQELIFGFFGPAAGGNQPCYDTRTSVAISGVNYGTTSSPLMYAGTGTSPATVFPEPGGGLGYYPPSPTGLCASTAQEFVDHMIFYEANLRNGHDSVSGFRGPFRLNSTSGNWVDVSASGGNYVLSWNLLPGVTTGSDGVAGITAFVRSNPNGSNGGDGDISTDSGVACSRLTTTLGFTQLGTDVQMASGATAGSMVLTSALPPNPQIVLCPYIKTAAGRVYPDGGASAYLNNGGSFNQLKLSHDSAATVGTFAASDDTQAVSTCKRYFITAVNSMGVNLIQPAAATVNFMSVNGGLTFWSDAACSTSLGSSVAIPAGSASVGIFIQTSSSPSVGGFNMNSGPSLQGGAQIYTVPATTSAYKVQANIGTPNNAAVVGQCYPVNFMITDSIGQPSYITTAGGTGTLAGPTGTYYTSSDCSTGSLAGGIISNYPTYETNYQLYFSPNTPSSSNSISAAVTGIPNSSGTPNFAVDSSSPSVFVLSFSRPSSNPTMYDSTTGAFWSAPGCSQVMVNAVTAGHLAMLDTNHVPASQTVTLLSTSGGLFFSDPSCTVSLSSTTTTVYMGNNQLLYYRNPGTSDNIQANGTNHTYYFLPAQIHLSTTGSNLYNSPAGGVGVMMSLRDANNRPYVAPIALNAQLTASGDPTVHVLPSATGSCGAGTGSLQVSFPANTSFATAYACELLAASSPTSLQVSANGIFSEAVTVQHSATVPGSFDHIAFLGAGVGGAAAVNPMPIKTGTCEPLAGFPADVNGHWLFTTSPGTAQLTLTDSGAHVVASALADCSTTLASGNGGTVSSGIPMFTSTSPLLLYVQDSVTDASIALSYYVNAINTTLGLNSAP